MASGPHVPVVEEKFGPFDFASDDAGLHSHLKEFAFEGVFLSFEGFGFKVLQLFV